MGGGGEGGEGGGGEGWGDGGGSAWLGFTWHEGDMACSHIDAYTDCLRIVQRRRMALMSASYWPSWLLPPENAEEAEEA